MADPPLGCTHRRQPGQQRIGQRTRIDDVGVAAGVKAEIADVALDDHRETAGVGITTLRDPGMRRLPAVMQHRQQARKGIVVATFIADAVILRQHVGTHHMIVRAAQGSIPAQQANSKAATEGMPHSSGRGGASIRPACRPPRAAAP